MKPMSLAQRLLSPVVETRKHETGPLLLMFVYSFLVMTSYNIVKPLTRAQFIVELGAENLPWVLLASGVIVGLLMHAYSLGVARLPPRSVLATTQVVLGGILFAFWPLFVFNVPGASVAFYLVGQVLGLLLISQFWVLANEIYDARQAKRLFGFIGGGASLGGITGSALVAFAVERVGTTNLVLVSGTLLLVCAGVVTTIMRQSHGVGLGAVTAPMTKAGVGAREAFRLLRVSRHLQLIALIIGFGAVGAGLLDQQLNMAVADVQAGEGAEGIAAFLGAVQLYLSMAGFVVQIWLTSRIHRRLGIGFAMLILPIGLGSTGGLILVTGALWAAAAGRIIDSTLRYTVDKTTREILFLPLPGELKQRAKPFIDVTVDRVARGMGAALTLVLIQPWGFNLDWRQLSWVSLTVTAFWIVGAIAAHRQYLLSFRQSLARHDVEPQEVRLNVADLTTIEALIEELADPDDQRVLYAIEVLESLDKRHLVTPLLLHHDSAAVRERALEALATARTDLAHRLVPSIERLLADPSAAVRAAAVGALASIRDEDAEAIARPLLDDGNPCIVVTAAVVLAGSASLDDRQAADRAIARVAFDGRAPAGAARRDLAAAVRQVGNPRTHDLLIPLLDDPDPDVADEAMQSIRALDTNPVLFAPALVSLLGHRRLKSEARATLVQYGEPVVEVLRHFLEDPGESIWVRRHIPATLARIPVQASLDILTAAFQIRDGFIQFKALTAVEKLHREHPALRMTPDPIEALALAEGRAYFSRLAARQILLDEGGVPASAVVTQALGEKLGRSVDRIYRLLGLLHPWRDVASVRWAIERGEPRASAAAVEYLDNVLSGDLRKCLVPALEEAPIEEKVKRGHAILGTRRRGLEATLLELINDVDEVVAAAAIALVGTHQVWSLRDDVEHILAHRAVTDQHVVQAASWTLAAHALTPGGRRERLRETLPAAVVVDRLRGVGLFATVWVDELFRIVAAGHQIRHEPGTVLFRQGAPPERVHLLLDGETVVTSRSASPRTLAAPAVIGCEEALECSPMTETVTTAGFTVTLALSTDELFALLADNTDLVQALLRTLVDRRGLPRDVVPGTLQTQVDRADTQALTIVQKGLVLRRLPLFAAVSGVEMLHLAGIATQARLEPGDAVSDETAPKGLAVVLSGEFEFPGADGLATRARAGPGDILGLYETLATTSESAVRLRPVATITCSVLRIERDDLFDLLGQRPDLLQQVFSALLTRDRATAPVVAAPVTVGPADRDEPGDGRAENPA